MIQFSLKDHALALYHSLVEEVKEDMASLSEELINQFSGSDGLEAKKKRWHGLFTLKNNQTRKKGRMKHQTDGRFLTKLLLR